MTGVRLRTSRETIILAVIVLVAVAVRLYHLGSLPWEQDELYTLRDATDLGRTASGPGIMARPLFYFIEHGLLRLHEPTPLWLRIAPFVFGVAGVFVTWALARRVFGPVAGLAAALLVALSPWHLYASQFARYWTLVYLLCAWATLLLWRAIETDRGPHYAVAMLPLFAGVFTHPTVLFALPGVMVGLHVVAAGGRLGWRWPTRTAWRWGWLPLLGAMALTVVTIKLTVARGAIDNGPARGLGETLRVVPGMVQWMGVEIATAAAASALWFVALGTGAADRRWGIIALLGCGGGTALLVAAGLRSAIYADYGMAFLPLVYVTLGGTVQRLSETIRWSAVPATAVLAASALPGVVSHAVDGTRFNYQPAYQYLESHANGQLVLAWPIATQRAYAPRLRVAEFTGSTAQLDSLAHRGEPFWVVASVARYGLQQDDGRTRSWLEAHCPVTLATERSRLDFRMYRVELRQCGNQPAITP